MTKKPPYGPGRHGPTLLSIFQDYVLKGATPEEAAARLTNEIETGEQEVPGLKPGWRLEPKRGLRRPRLVVDEVNHVKTPSKTEFYYGSPRLDVVNADGTRDVAENFYGCPRARGAMVPPAPFEPPWVNKLIASAAGIVPPPPVSGAPVAPTMPAPAVTVGKEPLEAKLATSMTLREAGIKATTRLVLEAAGWLAPQLNKDSKVDDFKDACLKEFSGLAPSTYDKRVWPAARSARGWPAQATPGAKSQK